MTTTIEATIRVSIASLQAAITSVVCHSERTRQGDDEQPILARVRFIAGDGELLIAATDSRTAGLAAVPIIADDRDERFAVDDGPLIVDLYPKQARQVAAFLTPNVVEGESLGDAELHLTLDALTITDVSGKYPDTSATVPTIEQEATAPLEGTEHLGYPDVHKAIGAAFRRADGTYKPLVPEPGLLNRFEVAAKQYGAAPVFEPVGTATGRGWLVWVGPSFVGSLESRHGDDDSLARRDATRRRHMARLGLMSATEVAAVQLGGGLLDPEDGE